ncbi:MAG: protease HtpX [Bdellovibrionaceae bacterium]|jgi:heat shock protein HtpX|nr:protease HtpX [Pseudobdellovibrionaceae bacterium]
MLTWPKRIFLFVITNLLVLTTLNITMYLAEVVFELDLSGYKSLLLLSVVLGMSGSIISLLLSKVIAKRMMGLTLISPIDATGFEKKILNHVYSMAKKAGLKTMPEVGIYQSPEVNAFATGPSKNNSLVAVSSGLLENMDEDAIEGVLAHEISHIANGDMITLTLIQGIINIFVIFFARIIAKIIMDNSDNRSSFAYFGVVMGLQILLTFLGSIVVNFFSRWREYRADHGSAKIVGKAKMIKALRALQNIQIPVDNEHKAIASLKIAGNNSSFLSLLFATHPPLKQRIKRLEQGKI